MACATPVVATPLAVSSLAARPGQDLLVAREAAEFAEVVLNLLADREQQRGIGWAGRRYVELHHDWRAIIARLEGIYDRVIHHSNP
jgi:glycosyltransferase involved in cell wall biosynthesis